MTKITHRQQTVIQAAGNKGFSICNFHARLAPSGHLHVKFWATHPNLNVRG